MGISPQSDKIILLEIAWEVCQQLGGIYTVMRTKSPRMTSVWGDNYFVVGPYDENKSTAEFRELEPEGFIGEAVKKIQSFGVKAHYGKWLCTGRPNAVLIEPSHDMPDLGQFKFFFWQNQHVELPSDDMINETASFGCGLIHFLQAVCEVKGDYKILAHFHEWMAALAAPVVKERNLPISTIFTTHATMLGRYLAMNVSDFYNHLPFYNWHDEATHFNIHPQVRIERAAALSSDVFTTVSDVTAAECKQLLGRDPDVILPNGLNIDRFMALHEFQNLHLKYKNKINEFVMGHFFPSYTFDLDKTLYFFSSGRFEYTNKGFDITLESLARLNWKMKEEGSDKTVVFFLVTRQPTKNIIPDIISRRAKLEKMHKTVESITDQLQERIFDQVAKGEYPDLKRLVDDYWKLRLRKFIHDWKVDSWPSIVTHELQDSGKDPILNKLNECGLLNQPDNPVKVVYHPEFISVNSPLFDMDYDDFVRGCHLGVFPSTYEPWGYTPLECIARGVPAVTSDLAGFGSYMETYMDEEERVGSYVLKRRNVDYHQSADQLTNFLHEFVSMDRRERIDFRNKVEASSVHFDWRNLCSNYDRAHEMAVEKLG